MNFKEAKQEYQQLSARYRGNQIDQAEFANKVKQLTVKDEMGRLWQIGATSGKWYRLEGRSWIEDTPPVQQVIPPQSFTPPPPQQPPAQPVMAWPSGPSPLPPQPATRKKSGLWIVAIIGGAFIAMVCLGLVLIPAILAFNISVPPSNPAKQESTSGAVQLLPSKVVQPTAEQSKATLNPPNQPTLQPSLSAATNGLNAKGPWLLFSNEQGYLYAANPDGSSATKVFQDAYVAPSDLSSSLSPDGIHLALITSSDSQGQHGLALNIITLPSGQVLKTIPLTTPQTEPGANSLPGDPKFEAIRAITQQEDSLAWSPDGRTLAFIGVMSAPSASLYSYSLDKDKVVYLSGGPSQAYYPSWSPDGKYILYFGAQSFGTGAGYTPSGAWAVRADNSGVISLPTPSGGGDTVVGWMDTHTYLVYSFNIYCGPHKLRLVDIDTLKETAIVANCLYSAALDPKSGNILYTSSNVDTNDSSVAPAGTYLLVKGQRVMKKLDDNAASDVSWNKDAGLFFVKQGKALVAYNAQGSSVQVPLMDGSVPPVISPASGMWSWININPPYSQLFVGLKEKQTIQVDQGILSNPIWTPDGSRLLYFSPDNLISAAGPDFKPILVSNVYGTIDGLIWAGKP
jgi:hypothetical protein